MHPTPAGIRAILLGFERGIRRIDASKSYPVALKQASSDRQVLDWILAALSEYGIQDVVFIGGYHIEKVMQRYPQLRFYVHPHWEEGSYAEALARISHELQGPCLISETDLLYRAPLLRGLVGAGGEFTLGVQRGKAAVLPPRRRVAVRTEGARVTGFGSGAEDDFFYAGLMSLGAKAVARLRSAVEERRPSSPPSLQELFERLRSEVRDCRVLGVSQDIARASDPGSISAFVLGTKAQTLERLRPMVRHSRILDQICFTVGEWTADRERLLRRIGERTDWGRVVVRSSALAEDTWSQTQAGRFESILGVDPARRDAVTSAVEAVIRSFAQTDSANERNEVFIQPQLSRVRMSGVCLTRDLETGAPYMIVNYDLAKDRTAGVTSGGGSNLHTLVVGRIPQVTPPADPDLSAVVRAAVELEELTGLDSLDIEFAIEPDGGCVIFQVRPLSTRREGPLPDDQDYTEEIIGLRRYLVEISRPLPGLHGSSTILGTMPDWNPAEIIGTCPRPLALSLYQTLITDETWGAARAEIGYRDTFPTPLLVALAARPYVDVRASLNSFLPADLPPSIGTKLVDGGLRHLAAHPELHDKIEFEVAVTCLAFDFDRQVPRLSEYGLSDEEIRTFRASLLSLTDPLLGGRLRPIEGLLREVSDLSKRREEILAACPRTADSIPRTVRTLLQECRRRGTLPFSILARYAFIATSFLKSLVARGVLTEAEYHDLRAGMPTITTQVSQDLKRLSAGAVTREAVLRLYGHLRPGTYNILSPSYAKGPDRYFAAATGVSASAPTESAAALLDRKSAAIEALLREQGFTCGYARFRDFIVQSLPARELAKFEFTHNLSCSLDLLSEYGRLLELSVEELSFLPIEILLRLGTDSPSPALRTDLLRLSGTGSKRYILATSLRLPHLLRSSADLDSFRVLEWQPNYISGKRTTAPVVVLDGAGDAPDLKGAIVAIVSADPGYDWIFAHPIAGLVTQFGGVASHMAVRAAEFRLPAAIGCGELIFGRVSQAKMVELDCAARQIRVVL
jgi:choline kinase